MRAQVPPFLQVPGLHPSGLVVGVVEGVADDSTTGDDVGDDPSFERAGDVAEVATGNAGMDADGLDFGTDVSMVTKDDAGVNNGLVVGVVEGVADDGTTGDDVADDASFEGAGVVAKTATGDSGMDADGLDFGTDVSMVTKDDVGVNNGLVVGVVEGVADDSTTGDDVADDASFEGAGVVAKTATGDSGMDADGLDFGTDVAMVTKDAGVNSTNDVITACGDGFEP